MLINYNINPGVSQRLCKDGEMKSKHEPWCHCWERKPKRETKVHPQPPLRHRDTCLCRQALGHHPETALSSAEQRGAQRRCGRGVTLSSSLSDGSARPPAPSCPQVSPCRPARQRVLQPSPSRAGSGASSRGAQQRHWAQRESLHRGEESVPNPVSPTVLLPTGSTHAAMI